MGLFALFFHPGFSSLIVIVVSILAKVWHVFDALVALHARIAAV